MMHTLGPVCAGQQISHAGALSVLGDKIRLMANYGINYAALADAILLLITAAWR